MLIHCLVRFVLISQKHNFYVKWVIQYLIGLLGNYQYVCKIFQFFFLNCQNYFENIGIISANVVDRNRGTGFDSRQ